MVDNNMTEKEQPQAGGINPSASGAVLDEKEQVSSSETSEKKEPVFAPQLPKPLQEIAPQVRGVVGPTPEEAVKANETRGPLEEDLSTKEKIAYASLVASGAALSFAAGVPAIVEAGQGGLPNYYESLPGEAVVEIGPGVWFGGHTEAMSGALNAKFAEYQNIGVAPELPFGIDKGSLFLKGPDGKFYEFAAGERAFYHVVDGQLMRVLIVRDLARGKIELGLGKDFVLNQESLEIIAKKPITGEPGSQVPTLTQIRSTLTLEGAENYAPNKVGQSIGFPWDQAVRYENGHNVSGIFDEAMKKKAGEKALEIFGYPVSEPSVNKSVIKGVPTDIEWVLTERAALTNNPNNPQAMQVEGGLVGNLLIAALNHGNENLPAIGGPYPTPIPTRTPEPTPTKTPESKYGLTAGDGWAIYNSRDASTSLVVMNRPGLDEIRKIIGPNSPSIELALFGSLEEAQQLYGVDPTRFTPLYAPGLNGGQVDIGKKFQFKDEKGNGIVALLVDKNKLSQTAGLNWVKLVYANLMLGTLFPAGENPERDTALRKTIINNTELQVN